VVTHDREMVDKMRRRVIELRDGRVMRDEVAGMYSVDESTTEFAARLRDELGIGTNPAGDTARAARRLVTPTS
jgi:cell division transport system ATP-binding protein